MGPYIIKCSRFSRYRSMWMRSRGEALATTALFLATLAFPMAVFGQSATGRIAGIVLDPTRATIPGAEVIVRSESTGAAIGLRTNAVGAFTAAALLPGL